MKKLLISALVVTGLTFAGVSYGEEQPQNAPDEQTQAAADTQAGQEQQAAAEQAEIKGEVTEVAAQALTVKDESGKAHAVAVSDGKLLKDIKVGDAVKVTLVKGKAATIEKVGG